MSFFLQAASQRFRLQNVCMAAPAEEPLQHFALVADLQRYYQSGASLLLVRGVEGGRFLHPSCYLMIEEHTDDQGTRINRPAVSHCETSWTVEYVWQQFQIFHAVETEDAHIVAQVAPGYQVPGTMRMNKTIGISFAPVLFAFAVYCTARMVVEAHDGSLNDVASQ